jgi:hypothetical protein
MKAKLCLAWREELIWQAEAEVVVQDYDAGTKADVPSQRPSEMFITEREARMWWRRETKGASAVRRKAIHSEGHLESGTHSEEWPLILKGTVYIHTYIHYAFFHTNAGTTIKLHYTITHILQVSTLTTQMSVPNLSESCGFHSSYVTGCA